MSAFLIQQLDFILFFYGLAFVLLGVTAFAISRSAGSPSPWRLLGFFGVVHGAGEWLDLAGLVIADSPFFAAVRTAVMAVSYSFLLEVPRQGLPQYGIRTPGRWIYAPLLLVVAVAGSGGVTAVNVIIRYLLGFVGSVGTGVLFALRGNGLPAHERRIAFLAAGGWFIYAFASGFIVPPASIWPASIINQNRFFEVTGIPVQLLRGLVACGLAAAIWAIWGQTRVSALSSTRYARFIKGHYIVTMGAMGAILVGGWIVTEFFGVLHERRLAQQSRGMTDLLAAGLEGQTAPVDTAVKYLAGASSLRKFVGGEAAQAGAAHESLSLAVSTLGADRGYLFAADGALLQSAPAVAGLGADFDLAVRKLSPRPFAYFVQHSPALTPEYVSGYPVTNVHGATIGIAVLTKSLATFVDHIRSFETPFYLTDGSEAIDLVNSRQRLNAVNGSGALLDREVGETRLNGRAFFIDRRPVGAASWELVLISPVEGILASRVLGLALTLLTTIVVLVYFVGRARQVHDQIQMDRRIQLEELARDLDFKATTDPLTGLSNRMKFDLEMSREIARSHRYKSPLSLVFFDIDHFKHVNDTYGHQAGDYVLTKVSSLVSDRVRSTDLLARWGGEEFAVLLPLARQGDASQLAENLRTEISTIEFGQQEAITCSFGVAELTCGESATDLIARADQALYRAKASGRNRVDSPSSKRAACMESAA